MKLYRLCNVILAAGITFLSSTLTMAWASPTCEKPDKSFKTFLSRFTDDATFQQSRYILPLVWRSGSEGTQDASVELWTLDKILSQKYPLMYSSGDRKKEKLVQSIPLFQADRYAEVYQENGAEADTVRVLFHFRDIGGCWYLEEVDDRSL